MPSDVIHIEALAIRVQLPVCSSNRACLPTKFQPTTPRIARVMANIRFCRLCCEKSIERPIKGRKIRNAEGTDEKHLPFFLATSKVPVEGVSTELNSGMWGGGGEKFAEAPHGVGTLSVKTSPSLEAGRPFQVKHCCTFFLHFEPFRTFSLWPFF